MRTVPPTEKGKYKAFASGAITAGQQYFVQEDGTLGLTADSTSGIAGTAISAAELMVKE